MKSTTKLLLISFSVATLGIAGCSTTNIRTAEIGNVKAFARLENKVPTYYQVEISKPLDPSTPSYLFKLPNGTVMGRKSFTYANLKKLGFVSDEDKDFAPGGEYTNELKRYGVSFLFSNGELVTIRLVQVPDNPIEIAREHGPRLYTLPMSEKDIEELFGHPDKVYDEFRLP